MGTDSLVVGYTLLSIDGGGDGDRDGVKDGCRSEATP
jgi:hypothetical protein